MTRAAWRCAFGLLFAVLATVLAVGSASANASRQPARGAAEADDSATLVDIPDAVLRKALEDALGKGSGEPITRGEMASLYSLYVDGVGRLKGIEYADNLYSLWVTDGAVSDLAPLVGLTSLGILALSRNAITDVSALGSLGSLRELDLRGNKVSDVSALGSLGSLRELDLRGNKVSDVSALGSLGSLRELDLRGNKVSDVSALGSLGSLRELDLRGNKVSDVSALGSLGFLRELDLRGNTISDVSALGSLQSLAHLYLSGNPITDISRLGSLASLRTLHLVGDLLSGAVITDVSGLGSLASLSTLDLGSNRITDVSALGSLESLVRLRLSNNAITDVSGLGSLASLSTLDLGSNRITEVSALGALESLTWLGLSGNGISDVAPLLRNGELERVILTSNPLSAKSIETHISELLRRGVSVAFDAMPPVPDGAVVAEIADPALRGAIEAQLSKGDGWPITVDELSKLSVLEGSNRDIGDLSSLELATGLRYLDLRGNAIADLRPVADMVFLRFLHLDGNNIEDIAPLAGLPVLYVLSLADNTIDDLGSIAGMNSLVYLALDRTSIGDLPTLPDGLRNLYATDNSISDITALAKPRWFQEIQLSGNSIASLAPLAGKFVQYLNLNDNQITDISPLRFDSLVELHIRNNAVEDLSPLLAGDQLAMVDVRGNPLSSAALSILDTLREAGVTVLVGETVPYFPAAGGDRQGFVRVVNRSNADGEVFIEAVDDAGVRFGPVRMGLGARRAVHFNSSDLENGSAAKDLQAGIGRPTTGDWRLEVVSSLDIEVLSYVRTNDGFVTAMHDVAAEATLPFFNPGSNERQRSILRVVNTEADRAKWVTGGYDDGGKWRPMAGSIEVQPGRALNLTAQALENTHGLGDGAGKWRLRVRGFPWFAMSLVDSPSGHLTNLSTAPKHAELLADGTSRHRVPLFLASGGARHGFVRVINRSAAAGDVAIEAVDDEGNRFGPVRLAMRALQTAHFNSNDLEGGNAAKGLPTGVGMGEGDWRLELTSELDLQVLSYISTNDGFLTSMHDLAPLDADGQPRVVYFNPGRGTRQVSKLRLINNGDRVASVTIAGIDDAGSESGMVTLTVPAASALTFTSKELEEGGGGLSGRLGDGAGKWRLRVNSSVPLAVMSLLESPTGHLANVSTGTAD